VGRIPSRRNRQSSGAKSVIAVLRVIVLMLLARLERGTG
jgi:hypothetical protein